MSGDSFTEVTHISWFSRIKQSFGGIFFGLILFLVAFGLLFWNEGRAVKRAKTLKEGRGAVVSVTSGTVDPSNEGALVHLSGMLHTGDTLQDPEFGITVNAIKLRRSAEMYQWQENSSTRTEKKLGGGQEKVTTYSYEKTWSSTRIDSGSFKKPSGHENPGSMPLQSTNYRANTVTLGAFRLSDSLIGSLGGYETYPLSGASTEALTGRFGSMAGIDGNYFYLGSNPSTPAIGDTRVSFSVVKPSSVTIVSKQAGDSFTPYISKTGGSLELLYSGIKSVDEVFEKSTEENTILTWVLRAVGVLLMFVSLMMILGVFSVLADVIPFLGSIVGAGTFVASLLLTLALSSVTIAFAWIFYRPVLGISLLVLSALIITGTIILGRKMARQE